MALVKASVAKHKFNLDGNTETTRQLATSPGLEITSVMVSATGGAIAVRIHDSNDGAGELKDAFLVASNTGESVEFAPTRPIPMREGIYIVMEQGAAFGGQCLILYS